MMKCFFSKKGYVDINHLHFWNIMNPKNWRDARSGAFDAFAYSLSNSFGWQDYLSVPPVMQQIPFGKANTIKKE